MLSNHMLPDTDTLKGGRASWEKERPYSRSPKWEKHCGFSAQACKTISPRLGPAPSSTGLRSHHQTTRPQPSFGRKPASTAVGSEPAELHWTAHEMGMAGAGKADGAGACNNQQYGGVFTLQKRFLPHVKSMVHGQVLTVQFVNSSVTLKIFVIKWKKSNPSMIFTESRNIKNKIGMPVIRRYRGARGAEWQSPFQSEATG